MSKKASEGLSKRQLRKEELRKKERQQRIITIGAILFIALALLGAIIIPSVNRAANPAGEFTRITPQAYANENGTMLGDPNAKVKIEVFSDFTCSACKVYALEVEPQVIKQLVDTGQVNYIYYQFPFLDDRSTDKAADRASLASECAAEQNQFWNYKNLLYTNQTTAANPFSAARLEAFAKSLDLDLTQFKACMSENRYQSKLDEGLDKGAEMDVQGTPSVFVNGENVSPGMVPTFDQIFQAVQKALQGS